MRVVVVATAMAESVRDDVKRSRTVSMLLSLSMINDKTFLLVFARDHRKLRGYSGTSALCNIRRRTSQCRGSRCRKCRGRFTVTRTSIQDDTIRKQESTNEPERFLFSESTVRITDEIYYYKINLLL